MNRALLLTVLIAMTAGCHPEAPDAPAGTPPARRDQCTVDDDCGLYSADNAKVGTPGGPAACCIGGGAPWAFAAARKDWIVELDQFCASRPGPCPGGNGPPIKAVCQAGHCAVVNP
ncbi:MAG: hypothetical protein H6Q90_4146 [Deltaproteobacteria bacterium]|nr:hypothetical protein [Deltaproteobacteria bacterium]